MPVCVTFNYLLILTSNVIPQWKESRLCLMSIPLDHAIFAPGFVSLEKEMATHSSSLAWRIPGTEEPSGLSSMGSHRVGHD